MPQLFNTQIVDGSSDQYTIKNGNSILCITGTWGSGTVVVEVLTPGATWAPFKGASYTADTSDRIELADAFTVRLTLSGSTGADLDAWFLDPKNNQKVGQ